jgi:superfamily II DNA/RNA helicase
MHMQKNNQTSGFDGLGIAPSLLKSLDLLKFTTPTPIQAESHPASAMEGKDMIGIAQTGTGKTLAFGIPMIQRIAQGKGRGLVDIADARTRAPGRRIAPQDRQAARPPDRGPHRRRFHEPSRRRTMISGSVRTSSSRRPAA